jgi:hypothetical protein
MTLSLALLPLLSGSCVDYGLVVHDTTDVFYQDPEAEVDILLIVDNSCSMEPYQDKLSTNFEQFISFFEAANVDYQIGVVTTGLMPSLPNDDIGCKQVIVDNLPAGGEIVQGTIITPETEDAAQVFSEVVSVGICGSGVEMGLESAYLALTEPLISGANAGFLREEASLSLIFVSDEEDSSPRPVNEYINAFRDIKGHRARDVYNASALVLVEKASCSQAQLSAGSVGTRYLDVAEHSAGVIGNICESDFENIVTELSLNTSRLLNVFYLSGTPDTSSLQVTLNDEAIACDAGVWEYIELAGEGVSEMDTGLLDTGSVDGADLRPAVRFAIDQVPQPDSQIAIRYNSGFGGTEDWCTPEPSATDTAGGN